MQHVRRSNRNVRLTSTSAKLNNPSIYIFRLRTNNPRSINIRRSRISQKLRRRRRLSIERRRQNPINEKRFSPGNFSSCTEPNPRWIPGERSPFRTGLEHQRTFLYVYAELGNRKMTFMSRAARNKKARSYLYLERDALASGHSSRSFSIVSILPLPWDRVPHK